MEKVKILSVNSLPYSGSTILTINLSKYDKIASVGELANVYHNLLPENQNEFLNEENLRFKCSCGNMLNKCVFWIQVIEHMKSENISLNTDFTRYSSRKKKVLLNRIKDKIVEKSNQYNIRNRSDFFDSHRNDNISNYKLMKIILQIQQGEVFLDAQKFWRLSLIQLNSNLFEFNGIHLMRNGLGQIESFLKHKTHRNLDYEQAVKLWKKSMEKILNFYKLINDKSLTIKYEDYCKNSEEVEQRILKFAGISNTVKNENYQFHLLGNYKTRLFSNSQIILNEDWKNNITSKKLETFKNFAGDLHEQIGYSNEI